MADLREELTSLRYRMARDRGMPANASASRLSMSLENIFSDKVLEAICQACPQDDDSLAKVAGVSKTICDNAGYHILHICTKGAYKRSHEGTTNDADEPASKRQAIEATEVPLPEAIEESQLTEEQKKWALAAIEGENLFITGEAGTGKSFLLAYIVQELKKTKAVAVTATTGIVAASHGGVTLHSFAGIGLGKGAPDEIIAKTLSSRDTVSRWQETDVLIIDEISMLDGDLFALLEKLARRARSDDKPFGGLQLLLCGDFLQLPPVDATGFAFQSEAWKRVAPKAAELHTVIRQKGDNAFLSLLHEVRVGICSAKSAKVLANCIVDKKPLPLDGIIPTRLYCVNKDVDAENAVRLNQLDSPVKEIQSEDSWEENCGESGKLKIVDLMEKKAPKIIRLKLKAQVVFTKNIPAQCVMNGTRGIVEAWAAKKNGITCPLVRCDNGNVIQVDPVGFYQKGVSGGELKRIQLPLKLGWALTVHRSQGCTLSRAELQLENAFDCGQAYVALSRVRSLDGLWIRGKPVTQQQVKASHAVLHFYYGGA